MANTTAPKRLEIKKYANRRYYDSSSSRHLTLEEIQSLVQQGYDIHAVDARTKTDITAQVLTQIILELDTAKLHSFPVPLLVRVIRMNDQLIKDFIEKYFNQALRSFVDYQQTMEDQLRRSHGLPAVFPSVSAWTRAMIEPFAAGFHQPTGSNTSDATPPDPAAAGRENADLQRTVRDLRAQVAHLSQTLNRRKAGVKPARRRRSQE